MENWKILGESIGNYISVGTKKKQVCKVNWGENDFENAKLIAAAPQMLKALEQCVATLAKYKSDESVNALFVVKQAVKQAKEG